MLSSNWYSWALNKHRNTCGQRVSMSSYLGIIEDNKNKSKMKRNALLPKEKKNVSGFVECSHLQFNRAPDISENSFECSQYFPTVVVVHMWINMHIFLIIYFGNILLPRLKYCFCDFFPGYSLMWSIQK